jgi:CDP-diacylglycerol--glycerol-3-phosphate 3-phosphatidyltransferase/archaetidylinositol phosphate synthase
MVKLLGRLRARYERAMQPIGKRLGKMGATPNTITTFSLILAVLAALAYASKAPLLGALGLVSSGIVDMLDGAVARATGKATKFGAVYDPVLDRYAEFAILVGIAVGGFTEWVWAIFALFGMVMASYTRARAESSGGLKSCTVGIAERQEKILLLLVGSLLQPFVSIALSFCVILVGVLSHVTVVQRLYFTFKNTRR